MHGTCHFSLSFFPFFPFLPFVFTPVFLFLQFFDFLVVGGGRGVFNLDEWFCLISTNLEESLTVIICDHFSLPPTNNNIYKSIAPYAWNVYTLPYKKSSLDLLVFSTNIHFEYTDIYNTRRMNARGWPRSQDKQYLILLRVPPPPWLACHCYWVGTISTLHFGRKCLKTRKMSKTNFGNEKD